MDHYAGRTLGERTVQVRMPETLGRQAFLADLDATIALADQQGISEGVLIVRVQALAGRHGFSAYLLARDEATIVIDVGHVA